MKWIQYRRTYSTLSPDGHRESRGTECQSDTERCKECLHIERRAQGYRFPVHTFQLFMYPLPSPETSYVNFRWIIHGSSERVWPKNTQLRKVESRPIHRDGCSGGMSDSVWGHSEDTKEAPYKDIYDDLPGCEHMSLDHESKFNVV